jgi:AcrR family transcriptional regulator
MSAALVGGRPNQKMRTRKHLLQAAAHLLKQGGNPTLEDVAAAALVSRATAYRYFPNVEALLVEASLDIAMPDPDDVFDGYPNTDPVARLERADTAMHDAILANETALRRLIAHALQPRADDDAPGRQNRRTPLIEAALEPARGEFKPSALPLLRQALALVIGSEAMLVTKDVLQLDDAQARRVKRWAIRALVQAART